MTLEFYLVEFLMASYTFRVLLVLERAYTALLILIYSSQAKQKTKEILLGLASTYLLRLGL